jgi:hypothetical protein
VTGVTATAPLVSSGGAAPNLTITPATSGAAGSMSAADKTKLDGAATIVSAVTGTLPITVATGTSTPVIAINAATTGALGAVQIGTNIDVTTGTISIKNASATDKGVIEIATLAEAATGTDATLALTPSTGVPKDAATMTGAALIPGGNDAARPGTPATGMLRYNSQSGTPVSMEYYDGANWSSIAPRTGGRLLAIANFDGTTATPTIRSSANVSSITTITTAQYRVSFINPAQNSNYALSGSSATNVSGSPTFNNQAVYPAVSSPTYVNKTTTSMDIMASVSGANNVWDVSVIFTTI